MMDVDVDDLLRVLRGERLPTGQVALLSALHDSEGDAIPLTQIFAGVRWGDVGGFNSILQTFAQRVNSTDGFVEEAPGYEVFFARETIDGEGHLRLRPKARRAVERYPPLANALEASASEVIDREVAVDPTDAPPPEEVRRPDVRPEPSVDPAPTADEATDGDELAGHWRPESPEDELIADYVSGVGGTVVTEVPVGADGPSHWPDGTAEHRIDAVRVPSDGEPAVRRHGDVTAAQLEEILSGRHVEALAAGPQLNLRLLGSAIAARDLVERAYHPSTVDPVVVCSTRDPALSWVARRRGIRTVEPIDLLS